MMDTENIQQTWITSGYENNRRDFMRKSSMAEYAESRERYRDSPKPVKSRADIILTEIEKQLEVTESEYVSAMERLQYSKMLYDTAGSMSLPRTQYNRTDESPITERNSQSDVSSNHESVDDKNCAKYPVSDDTKYFKETNDAPQRGNEEIEININESEPSPVNTARSHKATSGSNIFHDVCDENRNDWDGQIYFSERARGGRTNSTYQSSMENCVADNANIGEGLSNNETSTRRQYPYQLHLAEYSKGLQEELEEESRNAESPTMNEDREIYSSELKSSVRDCEKPELLRLNISDSLESVRTSRNKKFRSDKQRRTSRQVASKSIDETVGVTSKRKRKKRGGLKASNSRCTTATRDTSISENKKDMKKRKPRGHSTMTRLPTSRNRGKDVATKSQNNMSEVVEIYHNTAIKSGSLSVVSSKHSKLIETRARGIGSGKFDQPSRIKKNYRLIDRNNEQGERAIHDIVEQKSKKQGNIDSNRSTEIYGNHDENLRGTTDLGSGEPNSTNDQAECLTAEEAPHKADREHREHRNHQDLESPEILSPCNDIMSTRNYESPTVSSRLKQVHRSYFNRFNFRHIPFVVGTSVNPSYNLGLNIQEALSLMKARQMIHGGVSPMLISNVSKGIKPMSTLLGCIRDEATAEQTNSYDVNSRGLASMFSGQLMEGKASRSMQLGPFPLKPSRPSCIADAQNLSEIQESCIDPKIELIPKRQKTRSICSSMKFNQQKNSEFQPELTQSVLLRQRQEELRNSDSQPMKWQITTESSKGIREVLMNFHDQYEAMILKFEKLQEQAKKTGDKSLDKEIAHLEKELNAKEKEINAVASLYQEVMMLKQQVRLLHEKNSLVCVATELPGGPTSPYFSIGGQTTNPIRTINLYRRDGSLSHHGPPTSTKLAGLLRQIKTFQKKLKSPA